MEKSRSRSYGKNGLRVMSNTVPRRSGNIEPSCRLTPVLLTFLSKATERPLCAKCACPMERVRSGKLGFRAFRCPQCSHMEEHRIDTGVIPRADGRRASHHHSLD